MITRFRLLTACVSVFLHSAALAGPINFGNNPIMFTNPSVVHGDGATAMIVPNVPQLVKLANGLSVVNFSYTATITALAPGSKFGLVYIDWNATRMGTLAMNSDLVLTTSGNTTITFTGGDVDFRISGALDSAPRREPLETSSSVHSSMPPSRTSPSSGTTNRMSGRACKPGCVR